MVGNCMQAASWSALATCLAVASSILVHIHMNCALYVLYVWCVCVCVCVCALLVYQLSYDVGDDANRLRSFM
jgi:TctA family transporter